jgi:hypothetical protein
MLSKPARALSLMALAAILGACSADETSEEGELTSSGEIEVKADGITLWLDPVAHPTVRFDQPEWRFDGRASKNLASVFSFSSDDEFGEAVQTSARKFQVFVDANQLAHLLAGYRLLLDVKAATGSVRQYSASIRVAPKLERAHGSSKITLRKTFSPFLFGRELRFRNQIGFVTSFTDSTASADEGLTPASDVFSGLSATMDWTAPALVELSRDPTSEIDVSATNAGGSVTRSGGVDIGVSSFQLTTAAALTHWPDPQCASKTLECLKQLPAGAVDRSTCGAAIDVLPCLYQLPASADESTFSSDLAAYMSNYYGEHGADVAAAHGSSIGLAEGLCSASKVSVVANQADDPHAHDLTKFIVWKHPDVVYVGSDRAWFGAYDRATGTLESIYDFE